MNKFDYDLIIHFGLDEKFLNSAIDQFNHINCSNEFFILNTGKGYKKYIKPSYDIYYGSLLTLCIHLFKFRNKKCFVVFHGYNFRYYLLRKILREKKCKFIWLLWGAEFYGNSIFFPSNLSNASNKEFFSAKPILYTFKKKIRKKIQKIKDEILANSLRNIDCLGVPYKEQIVEIEEKLSKKFHILRFTYYPLDINVLTLNKTSKKRRVLLGNSASVTNNHIEAIDLLSKLEIQQEILVPLSYGNVTNASIVRNYGLRNIGDNFIALTNFMSIEKYQDLLSTCSHAIMNHKRQEAFGNLVYLAFLGVKIYLNPQNCIYHYFKRIGLSVFLVSQIENEIQIELEKESQLLNSQLILTELSTKRMRKDLISFFQKADA